jgi:hypothetical protein
MSLTLIWLASKLPDFNSPLIRASPIFPPPINPIVLEATITVSLF